MSELNYTIDVRNISKSFNKRKVIDNMKIKVPRGKIYGFLGPNGSGKTTTIRMLCGLITPDAGEGTCLGYDIFSESDFIREKIGYMTQKFSYWEDLTIKENLEFVADMYGIDKGNEKIHLAIKGLGLEKYQDQLAGNLSGGWKQRLALTACILHEPELLLLDEPTAGVDPKARREFWDEIHKLADKGLTVLVSTHYMDEAERCHAIIYISGGKIITEGTVEEVIKNAGLTTWIAEGKDLMHLQRELEKNESVTTVAPFGGSLHISGVDSEKLFEAIKPYFDSEYYHWRKSSASMEDAFIHYTICKNSENDA